jgi:hypothetical protein
VSQAGVFLNSVLPPFVAVQTITGNTGGPVSPDGSDNINVVGDGTSIEITGNPGTHTLTVAITGTTNHDVQVGNASGTLTSITNGTTGQVLTASTGANPSWQNLPSITNSFPTDSGTAIPSAGVLNIVTGNTSINSGSSVFFTGSGDTVTLSVTDSLFNTIVGKGAGNSSLTGQQNVSLGYLAGNAITSGSFNTIVGKGALGTTSGSYNIAVGELAGSSYISTESSNIVIGNTGTVTENNTIRIGTNGSGSGQQSSCYIAGIAGVNVGSVATVVTEASNQLGTAVITGGTGITVTTGANSIVISGSGSIVFTYTNVNTSPYTVLITDDYLSVDSSGGAISILLPNAATLGKTYVIKDRTGSAAVHNITVTTVGGLVDIDGAATFVMNTAYQSISVIGNNSSYEIY